MADHLAARQALAYVVVGFAFQPKGDAVRQKGGKALSRRTGKLHLQRIVFQALRSVPSSQCAGKHRASGSVLIGDGEVHFHGFLMR